MMILFGAYYRGGNSSFGLLKSHGVLLPEGTIGTNKLIPFLEKEGGSVVSAEVQAAEKRLTQKSLIADRAELAKDPTNLSECPDCKKPALLNNFWKEGNGSKTAICKKCWDARDYIRKQSKKQKCPQCGTLQMLNNGPKDHKICKNCYRQNGGKH